MLQVLRGRAQRPGAGELAGKAPVRRTQGFSVIVTSAVSGSTVTVAGPTVKVTVPGSVTAVTAAPPPRAVAMAGDRTYQIGVDVQPGTYVASPAASGNCYWARLKGGEEVENIIDNGNSSGQVVVTIKPSDKLFESSGCSDWSRR